MYSYSVEDLLAKQLMGLNFAPWPTGEVPESQAMALEGFPLTSPQQVTLRFHRLPVPFTDVVGWDMLYVVLIEAHGDIRGILGTTQPLRQEKPGKVDIVICR